MEEVDKGQTNLTPEERNRNKRSGDIFVYFRKTEKPAIKCLQLKEEENYEASFTSNDSISGKVTGKAGTNQHGNIDQTTEESKEVSSEQNNTIIQVAFEHPSCEPMVFQILPGAILPPREVEDYEIHSINREFFEGWKAIQ